VPGSLDRIREAEADRGWVQSSGKWFMRPPSVTKRSPIRFRNGLVHTELCEEGVCLIPALCLSRPLSLSFSSPLPLHRWLFEAGEPERELRMSFNLSKFQK
jgi:hypothetical protein